MVTIQKRFYIENYSQETKKMPGSYEYRNRYNFLIICNKI